MRMLEKDVLMICKGWFNADSRSAGTELCEDALFDYQSLKTGCDKQYLTDNDIFEFCLLPAMKSFFDQSDWIEMIKERMVKDVIFSNMDRKTIILTQKYINKLCVRQLTSLDVKNIVTGKWVIDLSDYDDIESDADWWLNN